MRFSVILFSLALIAAPAWAQDEKPDVTQSTTEQTATEVQGNVAESSAPAHAESGAKAQDSSHQSAAAAHHIELPELEWHHAGPFGTFDRAQLQRGFQVYKQVCAACHSMKQLSYRNLTALGYNEDQVKAIAAEYQVTDGPNDEGEMFERPARPSDKFKSPFPNEKAARAANGGAYPKDLSLMVKARHGREDYIHALLTGYVEPPAGTTVPSGMYYNKYFEGHLIAMAPPLQEGVVSYADGTEATPDQMAKDVATFLAWAAEPEMEVRKKMGMQVIIFLVVFSVVMYLAKKAMWKDQKKKPVDKV